ncbi:MAG TPA: DUF3089 domain-containing protein [Methanocorpusculum sp.]|nr:DUF3089 domain-containing protein [Methanocorpusculum sp.]
MKKLLHAAGLAALVVGLCATGSGCAQKSQNTDKTAQNSPAGIKPEHIDYSNKNYWMLYPETPRYAVDTVFIYPTAPGSDQSVLYCSIDDAAAHNEAQRELVENAGAFLGITNVYAPYYRQVTPAALARMTKQSFAEAVCNLPAKDVFDALDYYFTHANKGAERPFILASHSQGSCTMRFVLAEYMKVHPEYYRNMIAAYVIGQPITDAYLAANPHLKFAAGETDTGVIISWTAENPGGSCTDTSLVWDENMHLINPLNWKTDDTYAGIEENLGSLKKLGEGKYLTVAGLADAKIDPVRKVLVCTTFPSSLKGINNPLINQAFGQESLHYEEYMLYQENIHANVLKRINAFFAK